MQCDECGDILDTETDRHYVERTSFVDPEIGLEDKNGRVLCMDCARPHLADRTARLAEELPAE